MPEHFEKCRYGILVNDEIVCGCVCAKLSLEIVSDDVSKCEGCADYTAWDNEDTSKELGQ